MSAYSTRAATLDDMALLHAIEADASPYPWTLGQWLDSYRAQHHIEVAIQADDPLSPMASWVAMQGVQEVHLLNIVVHPLFQQQGIGRFLMRSMARWAETLQAQYIWLEVRESNHRAHRLYQRCGFEHVARRSKYYPLSPKEREDALIMRARPLALLSHCHDHFTTST